METNRDRILDTLDIYSDSNTSFLFAKAVRMLGFPGPIINRDAYSTTVGTKLNVEVDLSRIPHSINSKRIYPFIRSAIRESSNDEREIEFLVSDIISKFSGIIDYVNPEASYCQLDKQIAALTLHATTWYETPFDSTKQEWRKYELHYDPNLSEEELDKAVDYREELYVKFMKSDLYSRVYSVMEDMNVVAGLIDAALLENHCEYDFFYFQRKAGGTLTNKLRAFDLHRYSGVNADRINSLYRDRIFYNAIPPCESLLPELIDQINNYRNTGTWNMTKLSYLQVIAVKEEERRSNLQSYFSDYHRYVYMLNDDGILRDLGPIFFDLFEMWEEVHYWKTGGMFPKFPCKDIESVFEHELIRYICITYFIYLTNPKDIYFDVYTLFPGLTVNTILDFLSKENHFIDKNDFDKYEEQAEAAGYIYQPFEGFYNSRESTRDAKKRNAEGNEQHSPTSIIVDTDVLINSLGKDGSLFDKTVKVAKELDLPQGDEEQPDESILPDSKLNDAENYKLAHKLYGKLCSLKFIKPSSTTSYVWCSRKYTDNKARAILGYLCYMMWRYFMPENDQMDRAVFCSIIQSKFDRDTIGRYARDFKLQYGDGNEPVKDDGKRHKSIPADIKKDIDKIFEDLQKEGYYSNPY